MNRRIFSRTICIAVLVCSAIDFPICDSFQENDTVQYAGISGKHLKKGAEVAKEGWKWLKSCSGKKPPILTNNKRIYGLLSNSSQIHVAETLIKGINDVRSQEEVLPKIGEYLSKTKQNENGCKVVNCVKTEANEVKMYLYEQGKNASTKGKIIRIAKETINLAEYDIQAMQENYYKGNDGIEYVEFIIPRRAQYILNGQYSNRLYECMVFNVPKDLNGNWKKFKEYLIAFIDDMMNRPQQLWDEYMFRRGLADLKIDERDVTEMERYVFAYINTTKNDTAKYFLSEIA